MAWPWRQFEIAELKFSSPQTLQFTSANLQLYNHFVNCKFPPLQDVNKFWFWQLCKYLQFTNRYLYLQFIFTNFTTTLQTLQEFITFASLWYQPPITWISGLNSNLFYTKFILCLCSVSSGGHLFLSLLVSLFLLHSWLLVFLVP